MISLRLGLATHPAMKDRPIYLEAEQLSRHAFLCGKTGSGKTVTLINWCLSLAENLLRHPNEAPGFSFIDPHGDAVHDLLGRLPEGIDDRVHVLHFRDTPRPRGFNLLEAPEGQREAAVGAFVSMLRDLFPSGTGPRMEHILKNALLSLTKVPGTTIIHLIPLLANQGVRQWVMSRLDDPLLKNFWENEFPGYAKRGSGEALQPIQNKLGAFTAYPRVRRVVGQPVSTVDPMKIMDEGRVLLVDLSGVGEDVGPLVGAALVNRYHFSALSRAGRPRHARRLHILLADEIHNYATSVMSNILSEDRKFGLGLVLATQYFNRIPTDVLDGILGNIGTLVALRLNYEDGQRVVKAFKHGTPFSARDLENLKDLHAVVQTQFRGQTVAFTMRNPLPPKETPGRRERLLRLSDERDGVPAERADRYIFEVLRRAGPSGAQQAQAAE